MPPYIIFSDKTLIDMAVKVPATESEMLNVSGVGENKLLKYGKRFLALIEECIEEYPELIQNKKKISQQMLVEHFVSEEMTEELEVEEKTESAWLAEKREKHAGAYMPWTEEEDTKLTNEFKSGQFSIRDLSEMHGRTTGAIRARLKKINLMTV